MNELRSLDIYFRKYSVDVQLLVIFNFFFDPGLIEAIFMNNERQIFVKVSIATQFQWHRESQYEFRYQISLQFQTKFQRNLIIPLKIDFNAELKNIPHSAPSSKVIHRRRTNQNKKKSVDNMLNTNQNVKMT